MSELPQGWANVRLARVADFEMGQAPPGTACNKEGNGTVFVKAGEFGIDYPLVQEWTTQPLKFAYSGDVLICVVGATSGKLNLGIDCAIGRSVAAIRPGSAISQKIVYRQLQMQVEQLRADSSGTAQGVISKQMLADIEVALPPAAEQTRIANQLDTLLTRIQSCNDRFDAIPALLKRFRQAVTNAASSGELSAEWRGSTDLRGWESQTLVNVCNSITDGDHQAPPQADSGVPFITISAMNDGTLQLEKASRFVPQTYFESLKPTRRPARGDLLFSVTGSIGIPAVVNTDEPFTFQRHIAILKPNKLRIRSGYLALILGNKGIRNQVMTVATGTAQLTVPLNKIRLFVFDLPPIKEQAEIVCRAEALFTLADSIEARATAARTHARRLSPLVLAKAFRGELVPQDPQDESASALLERIAAQRAMPAEKKQTKKPRQARTPRALKEATAMTKSRQDDDVKDKPYLADHLRRLGVATTAEVLFKASELPVADFYKQLAWEVAQGHIADGGTTLEAHHAAG